MKKQTKLGLLIILLLSFTLNTCFAFSGHSVGNGDDQVVLAYEDDQGKRVEIKYGLKHLKLTAKQVRKRNRKLNLPKFYKNATLTKFAQSLEKQFGLDVYEYKSIQENYFTPNLKTTKNIMDSAVRFYVGIKNSAFYHARRRMPYFNLINVNNIETMEIRKIKGPQDEYYKRTRLANFLFVLASIRESASRDALDGRLDFGLGLGGRDLFEYKRHFLYSTTTNELLHAYVIGDFYEAMINSNLKGLDATVAFLNGTSHIKGVGRAPYYVIYPEPSLAAPIPKPVIFISKSAHLSDIEEMLSIHAPKIYTHNQLYDKNILPRTSDLIKVLKKFPKFTDDLKVSMREVKRDNFKNKMYQTFLTVNFMLIANAVVPVVGPITLATMLGNPITRNIFSAVFNSEN